MLLKADEQGERIILIKKFINTKVISFLILSLVMSMLFVTPTAYADEIDKVVAGEIEFLRSDGTNVYSFNEKEELTVKCDVTNNSLEKGINLYVASYTKNGEVTQMLDVTAESKTFGKNESSILSDTFTVPENIDDPEEYEEFPKDIVACMRFAREQGCSWLCLDCDGCEAEGLPTYTW